MEASFDEGGTWKSLKVTAGPDGTLGKVMVPNPPAAGHVALRVTLTDRDGNQVTQTVHRPYEVRPR
ncbi:hypothetical protein AB0F68_31345 [Micromonospora sp. NPDC023966]|uniref:hypothetical protein n=1 Tax=Micromonospora sp. NPDC023966 TaxID=3154699 RepID=UPI0033CC2561